MVYQGLAQKLNRRDGGMSGHSTTHWVFSSLIWEWLFSLTVPSQRPRIKLASDMNAAKNTTRILYHDVLNPTQSGSKIQPKDAYLCNNLHATFILSCPRHHPEGARPVVRCNWAWYSKCGEETDGVTGSNFAQCNYRSPRKLHQQAFQLRGHVYVKRVHICTRLAAVPRQAEFHLLNCFLSDLLHKSWPDHPPGRNGPPRPVLLQRPTRKGHGGPGRETRTAKHSDTTESDTGHMSGSWKKWWIPTSRAAHTAATLTWRRSWQTMKA